MDFTALNFMKNALANSVSEGMIKCFSIHRRKDTTVEVVIRFREKIEDVWHLRFINARCYELSWKLNYTHQVTTQKQLLELFFEKLMLLYSEKFSQLETS